MHFVFFSFTKKKKKKLNTNELGTKQNVHLVIGPKYKELCTKCIVYVQQVHVVVGQVNLISAIGPKYT